MKKMTLVDAVKKFVGEMNAVPQALIEKAYPGLDGLEILATPKECGACGSESFKLNESNEVCCDSCESTDIYNKYGLPMWGTMWTFGDSLDEYWARENLETMLECGFWVYESDELGVVFGIDGAGYDFYESHWTPLYKARGLRWHSETETEGN